METIIAIFGLISFLFCGGIAAIRWVAKRSKRGLKSVGRKVDVTSVVLGETTDRAFNKAIFNHIFALFKDKAKVEIKVSEIKAEVSKAQATANTQGITPEALAKAKADLKKAQQRLLKKEQELYLLEGSIEAYKNFAEYEKVKKVF